MKEDRNTLALALLALVIALLVLVARANAQAPSAVVLDWREPAAWSSVYLDTAFYWRWADWPAPPGESGWHFAEDKTGDRLAPGYKVDVPGDTCARWGWLVDRPTLTLTRSELGCTGGTLITQGIYHFRLSGAAPAPSPTPTATATATVTRTPQPGQTPQITATPTRTPTVTRTPQPGSTPIVMGTPHVVCVYGRDTDDVTVTWWGGDVVFVVPEEWVAETYAALERLLERIADGND